MAAPTAGLELACGEVVIILDADLPEWISEMLKAWRAGADMVSMQRKRREGETALKKVTARLFYRIINRLSDVTTLNQEENFFPGGSTLRRSP